MWTLAFWKESLERAIKTAAQSLLALWLVGNVFNVLAVDWGQALGISLGAMMLSFLTSVASLTAGPAGSPSLVTPAAVAPMDEAARRRTPGGPSGTVYP